MERDVGWGRIPFWRTTLSAWHGGLHGYGEGPSMIAVIHRVPSVTASAMTPIAGRPLIARQLEWLFGVGCARVIIETRDDAIGRSASEPHARAEPETGRSPSDIAA